MVVNSINFLLFFVVVFGGYYTPIIRSDTRFQNTWLFIASYFFYGFADWKMIPLLFGATFTFYVIGVCLKAEMEKKHTRNASYITTLGVIIGIGILLYFKYLNFFAESFALFLNSIGLQVSWSTLNIVLPIGVSFFTFKLISYVIEVHREHIQPCTDFIEFGTYVAFFPTILSGPIDRPNTFIPQIRVKRLFNYELAVDGCRQILWGMFTKMCIADNLAPITESVWTNYNHMSSLTLICAALLYPIEMYADFDGYSNMAIGISKLLGFNIARNFNHPFLSRSIAEYWRNWHISLTSWLTDYVFAPLNIAFRNYGNFGIILAILINFLLIGLWHGANWTFALFGIYHGLLYVPIILWGTLNKRKKIKENSYGLPSFKDISKIITTFLLVSFGLLLFRANSLGEFSQYLLAAIDNRNLSAFMPTKRVLFFICIVLISEWLQRNKEHALAFENQGHFKSRPIRWLLYITLLLLIFFYQGQQSNFIYFHF